MISQGHWRSLRKVPVVGPTNLRAVTEATQKLVRELCRSLLEAWEADSDLNGGYILCPGLDNPRSVEIRKAGSVPALDAAEIEEVLALAASQKTDQPCPVRRGALLYPLLQEALCLGACLLYPAGEIDPPESWRERIQGFTLAYASLSTSSQDQPPPLNTLAEVIPERSEAPKEGPRLHWEMSRTRVEVPVHEELASHLFLDHMPLF